MSNAGEIQTPNDYVVITVDIDDCPLVEFPLSELYDVATSLVVEDYLNVLRDYVTQVLDDTTWLDKPSKMGLLRTDFGVFDRRDDGGIFSLRKPALQRLIAQTLRSRSGSHHPIEVPVFVRFLCPDVDLPRNPRSTLDIPCGHRATIQQQRPRAETIRPLFVDTTMNFLVPAAVLCPPFLVLDDTARRVIAVHNGHERPSAPSSISGMAPTGVAMLLPPILQECAASTAVTSSINASSKESGTGPMFGTVGEVEHLDDFADFDLTVHCVTTTSPPHVFALCGYGGGTDVHVTSPAGHHEHHSAISHLAHHDAELPRANDGPSTFASSHLVSLLGVLLRYHPIDRGRRHIQIH
jgi:hypothetical protein